MYISSSDLIRIVLLDNESLLRAGLQLLLEGQPRFAVVAQTGDEGEALRLVEQERPDIVLIHENLNGCMGPDIIPDLITDTGRPRFILITSQGNQQYQSKAVQKGVAGIVMSQQNPNVLFKAIEKVHDGEVWLDGCLVAGFLRHNFAGLKNGRNDPQFSRIAMLSGREREVISLVGQGLKNQQIADQLFLSEVTVRHHLTSIYKKLAVADRLELVIYAYQNDLAQLPD
ncbi:MAG: response regulator transcription factor [Chloroflexi bacterium]|nr:response regulator transcription factor [Chloroflexota bacterium]